MHATEWIQLHGRFLRQIGADLLRKKLERQKGECTWCGGPVAKGRRRWCSQECVRAFDERCVPQRIAYLVEQRDKGLCSACGRDTALLERLGQAMKPHFENMNWSSEEFLRRYRISQYEWEATRQEWRRHLRDSGLEPATAYRFWEADHIVPVSEGGGLTGLDNYRTLCIPCHKRETAKLAGRRSKKGANK